MIKTNNNKYSKIIMENDNNKSSKLLSYYIYINLIIVFVCSFFKINEKLVFEYANAAAASFNSYTKMTPSSFETSATVETPLPAFRRQGFFINGHLDESRQADAAFGLSWSEAELSQVQEAQVQLKADYSAEGFTFKIRANTPFDHVKSSELSFSGRFLNGGDTVEFNVIGALEEQSTKLSFASSSPVGQRNMDISLVLPNDEPMNFVMDLNSESSAYTFNTRASWGNGNIQLGLVT